MIPRAGSGAYLLLTAGSGMPPFSAWDRVASRSDEPNEDMEARRSSNIGSLS
jgi:hypothetical protein